MNGGEAPSGDALRYERLVAEIASGLKMAEFGLPAKLSPESRSMVEYWTEELKENPCLIDAVESDVNNALDIIRKAERGERMESAHDRNRQQTEELREQEEGRPQISASDALVLQDILRKGGMEINDRNFPGGPDGKREFLARFEGLGHYDRLTQEALDDARLQQMTRSLSISPTPGLPIPQRTSTGSAPNGCHVSGRKRARTSSPTTLMQSLTSAAVNLSWYSTGTQVLPMWCFPYPPGPGAMS